MGLSSEIAILLTFCKVLASGRRYSWAGEAVAVAVAGADVAGTDADVVGVVDENEAIF
jgi:hypothetical protein